MRLLVIRTSAMGDVALTTPVLKGFRAQYPDIEIMLITRMAFKPFFSPDEGLKLFFPDLNKRHKGILGLVRLYRDINKYGKFDYVIDLHDVMRSKFLRFLFRASGVPVSVIDKGRGEKKSLVKGYKKVLLKHSVYRYCDTFSKAGFSVVPVEGKLIIPSTEALLKTGHLFDEDVELNIGVAPFAKHNLKMWPEENIIRLLELISGNFRARYWLFGGNEDSEKLASLQSRIKGSFNTVGLFTLDEELALMSQLDLMIAMDSSNMHMASLVGLKVISIWGGTDPLNGFAPWNQPDEFSIRIPVEELTCRPCTIYGKGKCRRGDFACMNWLTPEMVFKNLLNLNIGNIKT
jgi:ADP-heptose:LPS heptosyltransferase